MCVCGMLLWSARVWGGAGKDFRGVFQNRNLFLVNFITRQNLVLTAGSVFARAAWRKRQVLFSGKEDASCAAETPCGTTLVLNNSEKHGETGSNRRIHRSKTYSSGSARDNRVIGARRGDAGANVNPNRRPPPPGKISP